MRVVEIFKSIEGEGKRTGQVVTFIRLAGCNLRCSYCDTKYSFNVEEATEMSIEQILLECRRIGYHNITLTGGEPLIHKDVDILIEALCSIGFQVNIETNGSVDLRPFVEMRNRNNYNFFFTVDYKCMSSGMNMKMNRHSFDCLDYNKDIVKLVVSNIADIVDATDALDIFEKPFNIWISPVFGAIEPKEIVEFVLDSGSQNITVQVQLHKIIWNPDMRGV